MEGDSYLLYRSASGILMGTSKLSLIAVILFLPYLKLFKDIMFLKFTSTENEPIPT